MSKVSKMKIAMMVAGSITAPAPKGDIYAPFDIAIPLAQGLKKRGHEVTFYAPEGSKVSGVTLKTFKLPPLQKNLKDLSLIEKLSEDSHEPTRLPERLATLWDQFLIAHMFKAAQAGKHDLLHVHPISRGLPLGLSHPDVPVAYTLHDPIAPWRVKAYEMFASDNQHLIAISDNQRRPAPKLNYAGTVYNGIDLNRFSYAEKPKDYFLWVGRMTRDKNPGAAIQAALEANEKLVLIGTHYNDEYWKTEIEPYLSEHIQYKGFVNREGLSSYYRGAKALLMPIIWEEPFGLVMTEAMACGTPVIAFPHGSVPEIVASGKTGFIVKDSPEMAAAMKKIHTINRADCRSHVEKKFTTEQMVDNYERIFKKILQKK